MLPNKKRQSPNHDDRKGMAPSCIILHYTGMKTAQEALVRLCDPQSKVSVHYVVDENGAVFQLVDEDRRAWHAGASFWRGQTDINGCSIGVEIVNPGHEHGYSDFPAKQIEVVSVLCREIMARYGIDADHVLGHSDVSPDRKTDPGERFPWEVFAKQGIGIWPSVSDEDIIKGGMVGVEQALHDFGYDPRVSLQDNLIAFQRHFVPELFVKAEQGSEDSLTRARLYALLAGHWLEPFGER